MKERWGATDMLERALQGFQALPPLAKSLPGKYSAYLPGHRRKYAGRPVTKLARGFHPDSGEDPNPSLMAEVTTGVATEPPSRQSAVPWRTVLADKQRRGTRP